ncbi:trigger factor [Ruminococcus sp. YE71]|uniref:trigger factor n=1 Tax=unclassified Ruminococcus TaxID=2608920 RepID=UPI000880A7F9|nr:MULTISPECIES: trigger factor [unclassified Ruminococcus]SDA23602.1 trigger factor [Ruminococcus sp. YE78]SFW40119.1 trigger factor [Ruminococcus sp. YE71]
MSLKAVNNVATNRYELEIEISAEEFEAAVQAAYIRQRKNIAIPGFRKGKAPRKLIEREYGEGVFYEEAVNAAAPEAVDKAVEESKLEIVARPDVEVTAVGKEGVTLKARCVTKPEVTIDGYKGIEVERVVKAVTDEEVDARAQQLTERNARLVSVEDRAAQNGDTVTIDFKGFKDDVAFEGGEASDYDLELGSNTFIPGFEDQIVGHSVGEEFDVNVTFPEEYQVEDLKGAPAVFKIKLKEIKFKEVPLLDDDLVKDSTEFDTVDAYKADIRKNMEEQAERVADSDVENKLFDAVVEKMQADVPQEMYDARINEMLQDLAGRLAPQGISLQQYFQYTNQSLDDVKKVYETQAKKQVDLRLALEKIAEIEGVEPNAEEIEAEYQRVADAYSMELEEVKKILPEDGVKLDVKVSKTVDLIKDAAVIK